MSPAVFFDRDGTLNYDPGYLGDPALVKLYDSVPENIAKLKTLGFKVIVISNQSGIARGLISKKNVDEVNEKINQLLFEKSKVKIDNFYYCEHHPDFSPQELCKCRKPSPFLILKAAEENNIDLNKSYFAGDKFIDAEAGNNAGIKSILIAHSIKNDEIKLWLNKNNNVNFIAQNFSEACNFIVKDFTEESDC